MPPLNIPSDTTQDKILKAFRKIGFIILDSKRGKGSHRKVEDPKTNHKITVQHKIYKPNVRGYCDDLKDLGYDVDEFIKYL